jgi:hypothetical protein
MSFNPDKTEIMLFSNTDVRYNFNFTFNGNNIPITTSHKLTIGGLQQRRGTQPDEQPKCRERQHIVAGLQPLTTESVVKIRYFVHSSSVIVFSAPLSQ